MEHFNIILHVKMSYSPFCSTFTSTEGSKKYLAFPAAIEAISEPLCGTAQNIKALVFANKKLKQNRFKKRKGLTHSIVMPERWGAKTILNFLVISKMAYEILKIILSYMVNKHTGIYDIKFQQFNQYYITSSFRKTFQLQKFKTPK